MAEDDENKTGSDKIAINNVVKLYCNNAADDPDNVLEQAIGKYSEVLIIGWNHDDVLDVRRTNDLSDADMLLLMEIFKRLLIENHIGYSE